MYCSEGGDWASATGKKRSQHPSSPESRIRTSSYDYRGTEDAISHLNNEDMVAYLTCAVVLRDTNHSCEKVVAVRGEGRYEDGRVKSTRPHAHVMRNHVVLTWAGVRKDAPVKSRPPALVFYSVHGSPPNSQRACA